GLAISRAVMDMHGGTITATSAGAGKGATFTVEMDTTALAPTPAATDGSSHAPRPACDPCRILLVEDHPDTARVMGRLLGRSGYLVSVAHSVASALKFAAAGPFDLVISDIGLPDASGHDLMRQLKTIYGMKGIALSGYVLYLPHEEGA
ncbi:MAG TPA: response regulator, partial [Tepidisphaeraceae bacterium]|nr:response regulator [Tepidisphaeraceae bacterium]